MGVCGHLCLPPFMSEADIQSVETKCAKRGTNLSPCFQHPELDSRTDALVSGNLTVSILVSVYPSAANENSQVALRQTEIGYKRTNKLDRGGGERSSRAVIHAVSV